MNLQKKWIFKASDHATLMAEKKTKEQLKAEADARRAASKERQEAHAKQLAERRAANKQKTLDTMAARKEERESKAAAAIAAAAAKKEERLKAVEAAKAERAERLNSAKEARAAAKAAAGAAKPVAAAPAAPAAKTAPVKASARAAAAVSAAAAAPATTKKPAKPEAVHIGIAAAFPAAVTQELNRAVKTAALSIRDQVNGSLKLPDNLDKRELARLESIRKKLIGTFEGLISIVCGRISASEIQSSSLTLDPGTGRAQFAPYALEVANPLRGRISSTAKDLVIVLNDAPAMKIFSALGSPFMLQFFGDLETGQVLDGSLIMTANAEQPSETTIAYKVTLGAASKKVKGPALKLEFSHNLSASQAGGSIHFGFPIILPAEPAKS